MFLSLAAAVWNSFVILFFEAKIGVSDYSLIPPGGDTEVKRWHKSWKERIVVDQKTFLNYKIIY